jgi:DNA-binding transcriptional LysR family regulator
MSAPPPLRKLQYVLAVARELHFRKAAEKLHVSQPAVSRQVRECEEEFGFKILQRDHHFVALTKAGRSFVTDIEQILQHLETDLRTAIVRAQAIDRQPEPGYVVAQSPYAPLAIRRIEVKLLRSVFRKLPLRFRILSTVEMLAALASDVIHAGVTFAPIEEPGVVTSPLGTDRWAAVVPATGKFAYSRSAPIVEFDGIPVISNGAERTHPFLSRQLQEQCAERGFRFRTIAEVSSPHEAFDLVRENAGMAFLPMGVCEELPAGIRAITIDDLPTLQTILIHRPNCPSFIPTLAERLRRCLRKHANHNEGQKK